MVKAEYPRPQFQRESYINLNGRWTCHISRKGMCYRNRDIDEERVSATGFEDEITVPFAPETKLSGLEVQDIIDCIYYHRVIEVPHLASGQHAILHFGAVFYHAEIYVDGRLAGIHDGGSTAFALDITRHVGKGGKHNLVVKATANLQDGSIPSGKQSSYMTSYTCFYKRTTGIWQTVWLEIVNQYSLLGVRTQWSASTGLLSFFPTFRESNRGLEFSVEMTSPDGKKKYRATCAAVDGELCTIKVEDPDLWQPGHPALYSLVYKVGAVDEVSSYTALRTVSIEKGSIYLNGKRIYLRFVLDQGFYPDGNWTSPSDEALVRDILLSLEAGFNGARLHQKVFEDRFLYHADRLGYLVWAESPSWGLDYNNEGLPQRNILSEWEEIVTQQMNHPSIIAWTPLNETFYVKNTQAHRRLHEDAYAICKRLDPSRPVNDASGYVHIKTDLWTVHSYIQDPKELKQTLSIKDGEVFRNYPALESPYEGQPYLIDEYGGIKWDPETQQRKDLSTFQNLESWGYGDAVKSEEEFFSRLDALTGAILSQDHIVGYCYTQLTDVEQEKNGVYFYGRTSKFPTERFRKIFSRKPAGFEL